MTTPQTTAVNPQSLNNSPELIAKAVGALSTQAAADLATLMGGAVAGSAQFKCAYVMTALAGTYGGSGTATLTMSATGVLGAQDTNVTPALNDVVFFAGGGTNVTAVDTGPWVITTLGAVGVAAVFQRPTWWANGATAQYGQTIDVGPTGAKWCNSSWKVMTAGSVIGTTDPQLYPRIQQITLSAMSGGVSPSSGTYNSGYVFGTNTQIDPTLLTVGGTTGNLRVSTRTVGYPGTSAIVVTSTGGSDTSVVQVQLANW